MEKERNLVKRKIVEFSITGIIIELCLVLILNPHISFGQEATFYADSSPIDFKKAYEAEWKIGGQTLRFGSKPVKVKVDQILDTIYYKQYQTSKWDTLICNIAEPKNFKFHYNSCCGGFDVYENDIRLQGSLVWRIKNSPKNENYIFHFDDTAILLEKRKTLNQTALCRSVLLPNVYHVSLSQIEPCTDSTKCNQEICLMLYANDEPTESFEFTTVSTRFDFLYLPLSNEPLHLIYDFKKNEIKWQ